MSEQAGSLKRRQRLAAILSWWRGVWAHYWRELAELAMLACFVAAGFWLHPVAGLIVLGLAFLYVVVLTGPSPSKGGDGDGATGQG